MEKRRSLQVKMGQLWTDSSKNFLDRFLTDEADKADAFAQAEDFAQRLQLASEYKLLVVLQIQTKQMKSPETISGWVLKKRINGCQIILKLLDDPMQWRIVDITSIKKMSQSPLMKENRRDEKLS
ncbi:hypothetical protein [Enterococcus italicus]|uniref:hypothetical protein n=1 Tax=Enterococcus italicus TaxID=246144 RepID=UPI0028B147C5|nr:hypothetical protein [Enterococcus italicus]